VPILEFSSAISSRTDESQSHGRVEKSQRYGLYAQAKITDTHKAGIRLLSSREDNMRRVLRGLVLRHRKSQRGQVNTGKECLTLTEGNR